MTLSALGHSEPVRQLSWFKTSMLPESVPVTMTAYGIEVFAKLVAGVPHFALNRLELADVDVTESSGTRPVRGTAKIEVKSTNGWGEIGCARGTFATGTGIDLPDGTYRITSTAASSSGPVSTVEEVSFP